MPAHIRGGYSINRSGNETSTSGSGVGGLIQPLSGWFSQRHLSNLTAGKDRCLYADVHGDFVLSRRTAGSHPGHLHHVGMDFVSLASPQAAKLAHSVIPLFSPCKRFAGLRGERDVGRDYWERWKGRHLWGRMFQGWRNGLQNRLGGFDSRPSLPCGPAAPRPRRVFTLPVPCAVRTRRDKKYLNVADPGQ